MSDGIKWGEDPERDCAELKRLEGFGLYPEGHHDQNCSVCTDALPVSNFVIEVEPEEPPALEPREENTD